MPKARFPLKPAHGLVVQTAEGRRFGNLAAIPTPERRRAAIRALTEPGEN